MHLGHSRFFVLRASVNLWPPIDYDNFSLFTFSNLWKLFVINQIVIFLFWHILFTINKCISCFSLSLYIYIIYMCTVHICILNVNGYYWNSFAAYILYIWMIKAFKLQQICLYRFCTLYNIAGRWRRRDVDDNTDNYFV